MQLHDFCCYQFRNTKENREEDEDIGKICGRKINVKHDKNYRQKFFFRNIIGNIKTKENKKCYIM